MNLSMLKAKVENCLAISCIFRGTFSPEITSMGHANSYLHERRRYWGFVVIRHLGSIMPLVDSLEHALQDKMVICWL